MNIELKEIYFGVPAAERDDDLLDCFVSSETYENLQSGKKTSLLQKHMKPHCVCYILHRDVSYGTLCSTALSIGVVSARGSDYNFGK